VIVGGIVCVFIRYYSLLVKLCACSLVCNNCRWNCERIQQFIVIASGIGVMISSL
jgi:hypothetical protein